MFLPSSTYRVQLHKDFRFSDLRNILDYLQQLGIDTIYAAPILEAEPGSMHGYDVIDPHAINPEIGTLEELRELSRELKLRNMAWIQDIVPNHMAFSVHNQRLMDVLERGKHSPYYGYFDINWNHPHPGLTGKLMVPFLGKELDDCIRDGEIKLQYGPSGVTVNYFDAGYPLSVSAYEYLLKDAADLKTALKDILNSASGSLEEWQDRKRTVFAQLSSRDVDSLKNLIESLNNDRIALTTLLDLQWYSLMYWKQTEHLISYRRFFTVNSLICLRMEDESVFEDYHRFIVSLYESGLIQGIRIDHIDGLNHPSGYLKKLRKTLGKDCYIIAEKILEAKEEMPEHWPLEGTSGYEFLFYVNQLFTNRKGTDMLVKFYHTLLPAMPAYDELVLLNKRFILNGHMAGELENLVTYFFELNLEGGFTRERIREALAHFMLSLPVYRIYPDRLPIEGKSLELIEEAVQKAKEMNPDFNGELDYLLSLCLGTAGDVSRKGIILFLRRLMQFTGPLTAKGVEDTTFYIYNPLISHVEVGDAPSTLGITIQEYHRRMIQRQQRSPYSLNATATHDTKRGEDARVRLNVIGEMPELWMQKVEEWITMNGAHKTTVGAYAAPVRNDEYFIYQSILGSFPEDEVVSEEWLTRLKDYMEKVVREAKVMSNWAEPNEAYENACRSFIEAIIRDETGFMKSFRPFFNDIRNIADIYSVAQAVIKITSPGIPDIYQGCELLDLSFVDPDNRRPVNYRKRMEFLNNISSMENEGWHNLQAYLDSRAKEGIRKLYATYKCLQLRRSYPEVFVEGSYLPLTLIGSGGLAAGYARYHGDKWCLVIVPLALSGKNNVNSNDFSDIFVSLPANSPREWRNILTREPIVVTQNEIALKELVRAFPVAVLTNY
jgi:(1->4)-alpha-D-glucan 1-alpha-D-glucosylmutase